jgi:hypothetical protein
VCALALQCRQFDGSPAVFAQTAVRFWRVPERYGGSFTRAVRRHAVLSQGGVRQTASTRRRVGLIDWRLFLHTLCDCIILRLQKPDDVHTIKQPAGPQQSGDPSGRENGCGCGEHPIRRIASISLPTRASRWSTRTRTRSPPSSKSAHHPKPLRFTHSVAADSELNRIFVPISGVRVRVYTDSEEDNH